MVGIVSKKLPIKLVRWSIDALDHFGVFLNESERTMVLAKTALFVDLEIQAEPIFLPPVGFAGHIYRVVVSEGISLIVVPIDHTAVVLDIQSDPADVYTPDVWQRYQAVGGVMDSEVLAWAVDEPEIPGRRERAIERLRATSMSGVGLAAAVRFAEACGVAPAEIERSSQFRARRIPGRHASGSTKPEPPPGFSPVTKAN